jgi:hypothetical protein
VRGERLGLVLGRERVAVGDHLEPRARHPRQEPPGEAEREEAVVGAPGQEDRQPRPLEHLRRALGLLVRRGAQEAPQVVLHALVAQGGQVEVDDVVGEPVLGQPPEGQRRLVDRPHAQQATQDLERPGQLQRGDRRLEDLGREHVEHVAVGQHEPPDALGVVRRDHLREGPARVVAHERHVVEVEALEQVGQQAGHAEGEMSASGRIGSGCAPSGRWGAMTRLVRLRIGMTLRHSRALTNAPCTRTTVGPRPSSE